MKTGMIDFAFIAMICASWLRFGSFFLVVESFSILILTLFKMFADAKTFLIWVNEEDELRIISMQNGSNIGEVFERLSRAAALIEEQAI